MIRSLTLCAALALTGCSSAIQTSSGAEFLAARAGPIDPFIAAAAAVEPDLQFPARIGIARVINGRLTLPGPQEAALLDTFQSQAAGLGSFAQIQPAIARSLPNVNAADPITAARTVGARQHQDYVLVYTLTQDDQWFSTTTLAEAVLVDVRNGYVYGTANAVADTAGLGSTSVGWGPSEPSDRSAAKAFSTLTPEVADMFNALLATL